MRRPSSSQTSVHSLQQSAPRVVFAQLAALTPLQGSPILYNEKHIAKAARFVAHFGVPVPLLVNGANQIVHGNLLWLAAKEVGLATVPVLQIDKLSAEEIELLRIGLNKLSDLKDWDRKALGEIFHDLSLKGLDISLDVSGFELPEIDILIHDASLGGEGDGKNADAIPEPADLPVSKPGDLWKLGEHRLLCGNALQHDSYQQLMGERQAVLVFTDPPYNVRINGHVTRDSAIRRREFAMASGEMNESEFISFLTRVFRLLTFFSKDGSIHYVCMDWAHLFELLSAGKLTYSELKNLCIWNKNTGGMGSLYRSQHELVAVFKHGAAPHINNIELGKHGRYRTNVWNYPSANSFGRRGLEGDLFALHPTVKPVGLIMDALLDCSHRGGLVLDPFMGSGSSLIAAERTGRICYGIEIDPAYIDSAIRRWQNWTHKQAVLAETGQTFDDVAAMRAKMASLEAGHE